MSAASGAARLSISSSRNAKKAKFTASLDGMKRSCMRLLSLLGLRGLATESMPRQSTKVNRPARVCDSNPLFRAPRTRLNDARASDRHASRSDVQNWQTLLSWSHITPGRILNATALDSPRTGPPWIAGKPRGVCFFVFGEVVRKTERRIAHTSKDVSRLSKDTDDVCEWRYGCCL